MNILKEIELRTKIDEESNDFSPFMLTSQELPIDLYHSKFCPGLSRSDLLQLDKSYDHWLHYKGEPRKASDALEFGSLVHMLFFEPEKFDEEYVVAPFKLDMRKAESKDFVARNIDRQIIDNSDFTKARVLVEKAKGHPIVQEIFQQNLYVEHSFFFPLKYGGRTIVGKVRPDCFYINDDHEVIVVDLKTTADATPKGFTRSIGNYGYDVQARYIRHALERYGFRVKDFIIIACESSAPYTCNVFNIYETYEEVADDIIARALGKYIAGQDDPMAQRYVNAIQTLHLPLYMLDVNNR